MSRDAFDALLAYIRVDQAGPIAHHPGAEAPPVVTIARGHGAGGETVAAAVAGRLGVPCFDKTLLDAAIGQAKADPALMRRLDAELPPRPGTSLYASFMGLADPLAEYQGMMTRAVNAIAFRGGVVVGRGAHLLIHGPRFLRVRVIGSDEACARRLAGGDAGRLDACRAEVAEVNAARTRYIRQCFGVTHDDPLHYDLTVSTDRFRDLDEVAELIVRAVRARLG